ncbi:hypothetical protein FRC09_002135 [Ceratobasidium sp. 395]|nr:hypothetical protein FRC09_002135 [Ceratobasidium sp. 395]
MSKSTSALENGAQPKPVYTINLKKIASDGKMLDISIGPTVGRYRFAECEPLVKDGTLRIQEYTDLPANSYAAVSYVWEGLDRLPEDLSRTFSVRPTDPLYPSDPITIRVVQNACRAALKKDIKLLWLDRFSIMQSVPEDQRWQIAKMYDIYKHCALCIVIPSGLGRLSSLQEPTNWIQRGWTLQEAVAPDEIQVLFSWDDLSSWDDKEDIQAKSSESQNAHHKDRITIVKSGRDRCAMAPLRLILDCCITGKLILIRKDPVHPWRELPEPYSDRVAIFGVGSKGYTPDDYRAVLPNVAMLAAIKSGNMSEDRDQMQHCLWKSTFLRSTRYPADAVFSIMGLFGVALDVSKFDPYDPIRPAVALAQEILRKGDGAAWLGVSFHSLPCPRLSIFPSFPKVLDERASRGSLKKLLVPTGPAGYADVSKIILNEYVDSKILIRMPRGRMDDNGYLTFAARSVPVTRASSDLVPNWNSKTSWQDPGRSIMSTDGTLWQCKNTSSPDAFAVLLGCFFPYNPVAAPPWDLDNIRGLIVMEHAPGKFHVHSYFMLTIRATDWVMDEWAERTLCVGGPDSLDAEQKDKLNFANFVKLPEIDTNVTFNSLHSKHFKGVEGYPLVEGGPWKKDVLWTKDANRTLEAAWGILSEI